MTRVQETLAAAVARRLPEGASIVERARLRLDRLEAAAQRRVVRRELPVGALDFSSNDYLGLGRDPRVRAELAAARVVGSGGSRLLGGAYPEHARLEAELADWTGREAALLFSSGYLAALGAIVTVADLVDVAYSDARVHACAIDALRLAKTPRRIVAHATVPERPANDGDALLVTESSFGMDGSRAPLGALVASLRAGDALVVDEAHALGVYGPGGAGLAAAYPDERVIVIGTLSKALGGAGGFVAGPAAAIALLATAARTFIFDTAPPPPIVAAVRRALALVRGDEGEVRRARLAASAGMVRAGLRERGYDLAPGEGPVVAVLLGDERAALAFAAALERRGIYAPAIRPPTVPRGTARLRFTVRADHSEADLAALLAACAGARRSAE